MLKLMRAELVRHWVLIKAYPMDQIAGVVILAAMFYMLFLGTSYMAGPGMHFGNRLDSIFVGYVTWLLMMQTYQAVSFAVSEESTGGTFLQIMTSPYSAKQILFARAFSGSIFDLVTVTLVSVGIVLVTGAHIHPTILAAPIIFLAVLASTGFGFMLGSMTLLFRKASAFSAVFQYGILFAVLAPMENWGKLGLLASVFIPVGSSAAALRTLLVSGRFDMLLFSLSIVNSALFLCLGLYIFGKAERRVKRLGMLGSF